MELAYSRTLSLVWKPRLAASRISCCCRGGRRVSLRHEHKAAMPGLPSNYCQHRVSRAVTCGAQSPKVSVLPAGQKQARVPIPGCMVVTQAQQVLNNQRALDCIAEAITAGATGIVLNEAPEAGGAELYEAACKLKEVIRGRVPLIIVDRTDIAAASEADGVLLTSKGVPIVVARRMVGGANALVGRIVDSSASASTAAAEGANLVVLQVAPGGSVDIAGARGQQKGGAIPVFCSIKDATEANNLATTLAGQSPPDGFSAGIEALQIMGGGRVGSGVTNLLTRLTSPNSSPDAPQAFREPSAPSRTVTIEKGGEDMLESERRLLSRVLAMLKEVSPGIEEISLLEDSLSQLDELFLMVVVGEFNSGKSAVINSLLGRRWLDEGILPTTNEISILKHSPTGEERIVQDADGFYTRFLPSDLLRDVNIVDTPGTNVILERQQRLTEEFVPRADLVLFVISADRPFTDSEVKFLRYIKQWGKKVVFVVNKVDILTDEREVAEVTRFVADNAARLLGVEAAQVIAVSARMALGAKSAYSTNGTGLFAGLAEGPLSGDAVWQSSRFRQLERFVAEFLMGGKGGNESRRLKLQTPLFIADALLNACGQQLNMEMGIAKQEVDSLRMVANQLSRFRSEMERDGAVQRNEVKRLVQEAAQRAGGLVDKTLQLSNVDALSTYLLGSKEDIAKLPISRDFETSVAVTSVDQLKVMVREHSTWLHSNCQAQIDYYRSFSEARARELKTTLPEPSQLDIPQGMMSGTPPDDITDPQQRQRWRQAHAIQQTNENEPPQTSVAIVSRFEPKGAAMMLEDEIREAVIGTAGTAVGAGAVGVVFTWFLPTTIEDLLAMALAGTVAYASILNLPLRRAEAKKKIQDMATSFDEEIGTRMQEELEAELDKCIGSVLAIVKPLEELAQAELQRVKGAEQRRLELVGSLEEMKMKTARMES